MNKQKELFSFTIITYKNFDGIYDTLASVFMQDYPRIELIIADDGSPNFDDYIENIKDYIEANKGSNIENVIYSHFETNMGTVQNMNNAMKLSNGYYLKSLGSDDELAEPDALSRYVSYMESNNYDIVFAKLVGVTPDGKKVRHLASCEDDYSMLRNMSPEDLCKKLYVRNFFPAPAWAGTKRLFEKYGYFPTTARLIEDYPYWIHLCQNGEQIGFMDDVLIDYKLSGVSSTGNYSEMFMEDMFRIYDIHIFPYDNRYGILQPFYNYLKKKGLETYLAKARWGKYTNTQKTKALLKYGVFFIYIRLSEIKMIIKNK